MKEKKERTSKYETYIRPKFSYIEEALRQGSTEQETAKALGISYASWKNYKNEHEEFNGLIVNAKQEADLPVISALYKAATGYEVVETKTVLKDGEEQVITIRKFLFGNVEAQKFWLINRRPNEFKNKQDVIATAEIGKLEDMDDDEGCSILDEC